MVRWVAATCNGKLAWTKAVGIQKVHSPFRNKGQLGFDSPNSSKKKVMTHEEKTEKFNARNGRDIFLNKTPREELPLEMKLGSSTHNPDRKGGITTCDIALWIRFADSDWFRPYGRMPMEVIEKFVEACLNDVQIISLMEMLSAKVEAN